MASKARWINARLMTPWAREFVMDTKQRDCVADSYNGSTLATLTRYSRRLRPLFKAQARLDACATPQGAQRGEA